MRKADDASTYPLPSDDDVARPDSVDVPSEVRLFGRAVRWEMTPVARAEAARLTAPLVVEMELYFSCLIRKAVRFHCPHVGDTEPADEAHLTHHLRLRFRPVTTRHCALPADASAPPLETMPVTRPHAFVPRWLKLDYRHGAWCGEFGY